MGHGSCISRACRRPDGFSSLHFKPLCLFHTSYCVPTELRSKGIESKHPVSEASSHTLSVSTVLPSKMRTSLSLAAAAVFLLLLLTTMEAEAIRLDAESRAAININNQQQIVNKSSENLVQKDAPGKSSVGESETKRSIAAEEVVRATAHKLPEFHEDYYGASVHEPRHH